MDFEHDYQQFLQYHSERRSGERLRRLQEGHDFLERKLLQNIWYPAIGHFHFLHPEYEVKDFMDGNRFLDFAYLRPPYRIKFAADGYGPHVKKVDRWQHGDNLMRQNHLILDGWKVFRFSSEEIINKPRRCQQFILHLYGDADKLASDSISLKEREIIRFVAMALEPVTPKHLSDFLSIHPENARIWLHRLYEKKLLKAVGGTSRIRSYMLDKAGSSYFI